VLAKNRNAVSLTGYLVCAMEMALRHAPETAIRADARGSMDLDSMCTAAGLSCDAVRMVRGAFNKFVGLAVSQGMLALKCDEVLMAGDLEANGQDTGPGTDAHAGVTLVNIFSSAQTVNKNISILSHAYGRLFAGARTDIDERCVSQRPRTSKWQPGGSNTMRRALRWECRLWMPTEHGAESVVRDTAHEGLSALAIAAAMSEDMPEDPPAVAGEGLGVASIPIVGVRGVSQDAASAALRCISWCSKDVSNSSRLLPVAGGHSMAVPCLPADAHEAVWADGDPVEVHAAQLQERIGTVPGVDVTPETLVLVRAAMDAKVAAVFAGMLVNNVALAGLTNDRFGDYVCVPKTATVPLQPAPCSRRGCRLCTGPCETRYATVRPGTAWRRSSKWRAR
jgi:hypothetical protein